MENDIEQQPEESRNQPRYPSVPPRPTQSSHQLAQRARRRKNMTIFIIGGVVAAALLTTGVLWALPKIESKKQPTQAATNTSNQSQTEQKAAATPADSTPVAFKSTPLNIEITHRKDWTLKEMSGGSEIVLTSPRTTYTKVDGQSTDGVFTLKIRKGVTDGMQATINKSIAVRDSEVIAYTKPTDQQRYYTNLSYAGQKNIFNFFIVTSNTAIKAGNSFANTLPLDGEFYLLAGGYGTDKDDTLAFDSVPPSAIDNPTVQQAIDIVKSLKVY